MTGTIQFGVFLLSLLLAFRFGAWPERAAALSFLGMVGVDRYYHWLIGGHGSYRHLDWGHLIVDGYMLVCLLAIALKADREWTLWAAGAQVIALLTHPIRLIDGAMDTLAYAIMIRAPSWFQLSLILGGIAFHQRRMRRSTRFSPGF